MRFKEKIRVWLNKFINAYPVIAIIISIITLIPLWAFIGLWWLLGPVTFWEKLAIIFVGGSFLGGAQIFFGIVGLYLLASLYDDWQAIKRSRIVRKR